MDMIAYYDGDPKRIQHFTKVHSYARLIGIGEELDDASLFILEAAAYTHDIGIRVAEEKYGRGDGNTYDNIDGLDYQILVEADFLVNLYEDDAGNRAIDKAYKRIFKTETGKKIFRLMFGYEEED